MSAPFRPNPNTNRRSNTVDQNALTLLLGRWESAAPLQLDTPHKSFKHTKQNGPKIYGIWNMPIYSNRGKGHLTWNWNVETGSLRDCRSSTNTPPENHPADMGDESTSANGTERLTSLAIGAGGGPTQSRCHTPRELRLAEECIQELVEVSTGYLGSHSKHHMC